MNGARPDEKARKASGLTWLGKYLSLALTLPASVAAGYILGTLADNWIHLRVLRAAGIFLGMAAGMLQVYKELTRDERHERNKDGGA